MSREFEKEIFSYITETRDLLLKIPESAWMNTIVPKRFTVEKISPFGKDYLFFKKGDIARFYGILMTQRWPGMGRVFFFPYNVEINNEPSTRRFVEIKGYGQDGRDMCLWLHNDGDISYGMFYKNAKKEFRILEKACSAGLKVPLPLFLGKFSKEEWLKSGLRVVKGLVEEREVNLEMLAEQDIETLRENIRELIYPIQQEDPLSAFSQPYNAGVIGRAPLSPFRIGDPSQEYDLNQRNIAIARECGTSFIGLLNLGYLHLSPGTGNWTTARELTDMADCYDLRKDKNLGNVIEQREAKIQKDFWEDLIGPRHCGNLYSFFIEGIFGERISIEEAANELKSKIKT